MYHSVESKLSAPTASQHQSIQTASQHQSVKQIVSRTVSQPVNQFVGQSASQPVSQSARYSRYTCISASSSGDSSIFTGFQVPRNTEPSRLKVGGDPAGLSDGPAAQLCKPHNLTPHNLTPHNFTQPILCILVNHLAGNSGQFQSFIGCEIADWRANLPRSHRTTRRSVPHRRRGEYPEQCALGLQSATTRAACVNHTGARK